MARKKKDYIEGENAEVATQSEVVVDANVIVHDDDKELDKVIADIHKKYGEGSIRTMKDRPEENVMAISTRSLLIDAATGVGGLPRGRVTEIIGPESSGKTSVCLQTIAEAQSLGGRCSFIDMEHALDLDYAKKLGVNIDELYVCQPDSGEEALEIADALIKSRTMDVVVIDSVAALVPLKELEGEYGDATMGAQARLMSQALRKMSGIIRKSNIVMIFTNQIRQKIGVMFGSNEVATGGNALKFYASIRMDMRRQQPIKNGEEIIGNQHKVKIIKNKVAAPFREAVVEIYYGKGTDRVAECLDMAAKMEIVVKRGAFYNYNDERIGQGRVNAITYLRENEKVYREILALVTKRMTENPDGLIDVASEVNDEI